jgi:aromatic ring-opening dioxygenase catalytic subunit (LigB family)
MNIPSADKKTKMPTWFIPHGGGPCFFMDWNPPQAWNAMADFLRNLASTLPRMPKAIVLVSAHWIEPQFKTTAAQHPALVYDYYGFPAHTYQLKYPASGHPGLAAQVVELLNQASIASATDAVRGLDHGVFIPLKLIFPEANIPVVQLSLHNSLNPAIHLQAGQALEVLRDQDVLIIGSGMSFHNMRAYGNPQFGPVSDAFDAWLTMAVQSEAPERVRLLQHWDQAPHARLCHPPHAEEHLLPLMVVAGAAGCDAGNRVFSDRVMETTLSAFTFG